MAMAWQLHPNLPLILAANRDEFHEREATAMGWWDDGHTLAGRDLQAGGTWLGLSREGRIGLLTNVREPGQQHPGLPSRGGLVPMWLQTAVGPADMAERLQITRTNGYNLLGIDLANAQAHCWSNRHGHRERLEPGLYGLSNAALDTPWPKLQRLKRMVSEACEQPAQLKSALLQALTDRDQAPDEHLPQTGVPLDWERWLSSIFIQTPDQRYGTRCSTVIVAEQSTPWQWKVHAVEQSWNSQGQPTGRVEQTVIVTSPASACA